MYNRRSLFFRTRAMSSRVIVSRYGNLRREIAALAARLMAEEGVRDYVQNYLMQADPYA